MLIKKSLVIKFSVLKLLKRLEKIQIIYFSYSGSKQKVSERIKIAFSLNPLFMVQRLDIRKPQVSYRVDCIN